jgi:hypothetical protein
VTPNPIDAFQTALATTTADAQTACRAWTAHHVVAHLAAGVEETTSLIEDALAGRPARDTRSFSEREAPFLALADEELRCQLTQHTTRALAALSAFGRLGPEASFEFTGAPFTAARIAVHAYSEFAIHRWDLVGDDPIGDALLSDPAFTRHAIDLLNAMPILDEAPANRAAGTSLRNTTVVLRVHGEPDIALRIEHDGSARFEIGDHDGALAGDLTVTTDAVNRLLTMWGRRSSRRDVAVTGNPARWSAAAAALWPDATEWPDT